jgi:hypothetical protein
MAHARRQGLRPVITAVAMIQLWGLPLSAQYLGGGTKSDAEVQVADIEQMRDKFTSLAEAFPEETFDWRPMEGVRSVKQVFVLIAGEGVLFPTMWGFEAPEWVAAGGFGPETERLMALSRDELITEVGRSFDHLLTLVRGLGAEDRQRRVDFFGLNVDLTTAITRMATDMHEHLGQAIAYARMNQIVPPWSQPGL